MECVEVVDWKCYSLFAAKESNQYIVGESVQLFKTVMDFTVKKRRCYRSVEFVEYHLDGVVCGGCQFII